MKKQKRLTIYMAIFSFFLFICFGIIIVTEKLAPYFVPKIDEKLNTYLEKNYSEKLAEWSIKKTVYKNTIYQMKVTSKENKNLYFTVKYQNKKISDTYQEDYIEGKTLLTTLSNNLEKKLEEKYKDSYHIKTLSTWNNYNKTTQEKILKNNTIEDVPIYTLEKEIVTEWTAENMVESILTLHKTLKKDNITPKNYNLTITDKAKVKNSIKIVNLSSSIVESTQLTKILNDILNNSQSEILKTNHISYQILN